MVNPCLKRSETKLSHPQTEKADRKKTEKKTNRKADRQTDRRTSSTKLCTGKSKREVTNDGWHRVRKSQGENLQGKEATRASCVRLNLSQCSARFSQYQRKVLSQYIRDREKGTVLETRYSVLFFLPRSSLKRNRSELNFWFSRKV